MSDLNELIKRLVERQRCLNSMNGVDYDSKQDKTVVPGPILHQGTENATAEESAQFELDHPEFTSLYQMLKKSLFDTLE